MLLEPKKSYCIILDENTKDSSESFAVNIIMRYLIDLNLKEGITFGRSIFSNSMVISDTEFPNPRCIVLSRVNRKHQDFELINVSENKWELLFEVIGINPKANDAMKDLSKFLKANLKLEKSIDILYYYITNIYQVAYSNKDGGVFDSNKASMALKLFKGIYKGSNSRTERLVATINFIKYPKEDLLFEMLKAYSNDYKAIASNIQALAEDRLPKNLVDMFQEVINSVSFTKNILQIMSYVVLSEDYNEFILNCLKMVKS